jgi:hypothetical protein
LQTNLILSDKTANEIDQRVEKLLKDLGNPKPPLKLEQVRELLRLDLGYYSAANDSWLRAKIHKLKVQGKQVIQQPSLILTVVRSLKLKALLLPENRRILLDEDVPKPKHRWNQSHEIIHDILPWHDGIAHGDPDTTLSPACHERIEAEANYGAGRLLFLGREFENVLRGSTRDFKLVQSLHDDYGNTITTTLWRVVELSIDAAFGLVSVHPNQANGSPNDDVRYFIRSPKFAAEFSQTTAVGLFDAIKSRCHGRRGPIGHGEFPVTDDRGEQREFCFETFFNGHDALTLARQVPSQPRPKPRP